MSKFITLTTTRNARISINASCIVWLLEQFDNNNFLYTNVQLGSHGVFTQVKETEADIIATINEVEFDVTHEYNRQVAETSR